MGYKRSRSPKKIKKIEKKNEEKHIEIVEEKKEEKEPHRRSILKKKNKKSPRNSKSVVINLRKNRYKYIEKCSETK